MEALQSSLNELAEVCLYAYYASSTIALICFMASWLVHVAMVRLEILLARQGIWEARPIRVRVRVRVRVNIRVRVMITVRVRVTAWYIP